MKLLYSSLILIRHCIYHFNEFLEVVESSTHFDTILRSGITAPISKEMIITDSLMTMGWHDQVVFLSHCMSVRMNLSKEKQVEVALGTKRDWIRSSSYFCRYQFITETYISETMSIAAIGYLWVIDDEIEKMHFQNTSVDCLEWSSTKDGSIWGCSLWSLDVSSVEGE